MAKTKKSAPSSQKPRSSTRKAAGPTRVSLSLDPDLRATLAVFAARVGNELNNPLAAVLAAHQYLRKRVEKEGTLAEDPRVTSFMDIIESELGAASRVVGDLMAFGATRPVLKSCFLMTDMVDEAIRQVRRSSNVSIDNHVKETIAPVNLDREMCVRVLTQLIQNGADAIPADRNGVVVIDGTADKNTITIVVRDDGVGMSEDVIEQMKEPLYSTKAKGTGLGLSIADSLVRAQGGELTCETEPGAGTTIRITLPNG